VAHDRAPESVLAFVALLPDALELVEVALDQAVQRRRLGIPRPVDFLRQALHRRFNCPEPRAANKISKPVFDGIGDKGLCTGASPHGSPVPKACG
jgi:hypothetical protein